MESENATDRSSATGALSHAARHHSLICGLSAARCKPHQDISGRRRDDQPPLSAHRPAITQSASPSLCQSSADKERCTDVTRALRRRRGRSRTRGKHERDGRSLVAVHSPAVLKLGEERVPAEKQINCKEGSSLWVHSFVNSDCMAGFRQSTKCLRILNDAND